MGVNDIMKEKNVIVFASIDDAVDAAMSITVDGSIDDAIEYASNEEFARRMMGMDQEVQENPFSDAANLVEYGITDEELAPYQEADELLTDLYNESKSIDTDSTASNMSSTVADTEANEYIDAYEDVAQGHMDIGEMIDFVASME